MANKLILVLYGIISAIEMKPQSCPIPMMSLINPVTSASRRIKDGVEQNTQVAFTCSPISIRASLLALCTEASTSCLHGTRVPSFTKLVEGAETVTFPSPS